MHLVIDTDAGVDDAHALMLALAQPHVQISGITTVTGNIDVEQVNRNVFTVLDVMQRDIPVYQGAQSPLVADWHWETEEFHGIDGLGDWSQRPPSNRSLEPEHGVLALVRLANTYPGELTLVALGPLTNLALATRLDPTFPAKIKELVFMGGTSRGRGNTAIPAAEFNIYCDPEAAQVVLKSFPMATMISWEATLDNPLPWHRYETLLELPGPRGEFFRGTNERMMTFVHQRYTAPQYLMPDPLAMAVALCPDVIEHSEPHHMLVELSGQYTRGQTVIDYANTSQAPHNVEVVMRVDLDKIYELFCQMLTV